MSEEEQAREFLTIRREVQELEREYRCLDTRRERMLEGAAYTVREIARRYSADGLDSGGTSQPDLRSWPSADDLRELMRDLVETRKRLRNAKDRLARMGM